jgi:hypothetical protein
MRPIINNQKLPAHFTRHLHEIIVRLRGDVDCALELVDFHLAGFDELRYFGANLAAGPLAFVEAGVGVWDCGFGGVRGD